MQPTSKDVAIRKRTQIAKANRAMFAWIAIGSAVVGSALVVTFFLAQKLMYNEKVLSEKQQTITTLKHNNSIIDELQTEIRVLDTNEALASVKSNPDDQALQVILDALPAEANSLALGGSLEYRLLRGIEGITRQSLQVTPVQGVESLSDGASATSGNNEITFQFVVSGNQEALKQVLTNLERSIRTIDVLSVRVESQGTTQSMTVRARAFYEPAKTVQLTDKVVKP